jgi:hypothetical protein
MIILVVPYIKIEGTRLIYEIKKQQEKDMEEKSLVVLNDVALHDLVPIAYPNHGNEADNNAEITEICTALGIIDYELYLISALYLISHHIVHKMITKKPLPYLNQGQDRCLLHNALVMLTMLKPSTWEVLVDTQMKC